MSECRVYVEQGIRHLKTFMVVGTLWRHQRHELNQIAELCAGLVSRQLSYFCIKQMLPNHTMLMLLGKWPQIPHLHFKIKLWVFILLEMTPTSYCIHLASNTSANNIIDFSNMSNYNTFRLMCYYFLNYNLMILLPCHTGF